MIGEILVRFAKTILARLSVKGCFQPPTKVARAEWK
jgi:hypothetical protein